MNIVYILLLASLAFAISITCMVACHRMEGKIDKLTGKLSEIQAMSATHSEAIIKCHEDIEKRVANPTQIERIVSDLKSEVKRLDNVVSNINHGFTSNPF